MSIKSRVEQALHSLVGMKLINFGRAGNMGCFDFSEGLHHTPSSETDRIKPLFVIHVQCPWRLIGHEEIIVGLRDLYLPAGDSIQSPPNFNWDVPGANRCDERMKNLFKNADCQYSIERIDADSTGAVQFYMSKGYRLEIIPDTSAETEHWRLLAPGSSGHFIVSGGTIED